MKTISTSPVRQATFDTAGAWQAPRADAAAIDFYLRRGRQERARALSQMIRGIFSSPAGRASAEVHELPARQRDVAPRIAPAPPEIPPFPHRKGAGATRAGPFCLRRFTGRCRWRRIPSPIRG